MLIRLEIEADSFEELRDEAALVAAGNGAPEANVDDLLKERKDIVRESNQYHKQLEDALAKIAELEAKPSVAPQAASVAVEGEVTGLKALAVGLLTAEDSALTKVPAIGRTGLTKMKDWAREHLGQESEQESPSADIDVPKEAPPKDPTEAPPEEEEPTEKPAGQLFTAVELKEALVGAVKACGGEEAVVSMLETFGYKKMSEIREVDYGKVIRAAEKLGGDN